MPEILDTLATRWTGGMAQVVEPALLVIALKHEALSSTPSPPKKEKKKTSTVYCHIIFLVQLVFELKASHLLGRLSGTLPSEPPAIVKFYKYITEAQIV
jgi:hypothetical protein